MAIYAVNYDGLRKRDTYNELIDYIQFKQEKIIYPDRFAKRIRESPQISNLLDGEGLGKGDLEEHEKNRIKEILKEVAIIQANGTAQISRADPVSNSSGTTSVVSNYDEQMQDLNDMLRNIAINDADNQRQQQNNNRQQNQNHLNNIHEQNNRFLLGGHRLLPNNPIPSLPVPPPAQASSSNQPMQYDIHTPKAKTEAKPKSLNLLQRAPPPPAKAMHPNHPAGNAEPESDAHIDFLSKRNRSISKAVPSTPSTPPNMTVEQSRVIDAILEMTFQQLQENLKKLGLSTTGTTNQLVTRLVNARAHPVSAPVMQYVRQRRRRIDTPQ